MSSAGSRRSTMLPVLRASWDPPTALETLIRAYRALSRQIYDASSSPLCSNLPVFGGVPRGRYGSGRLMGGPVQSRSSNPRLPTELQTLK